MCCLESSAIIAFAQESLNQGGAAFQNSAAFLPIANTVAQPSGPLLLSILQRTWNIYSMLGKILLTLTVMIIAFFFVRQRDMKGKSSPLRNRLPPAQSPDKAAQQEDNSLSADLRLGAYMFLALVIGLGAALYYFQWQDDHSILTVRLHSDGAREAMVYQVYKFQLAERSFTTLDGIVVTVASSERMEVEGL
tara:strand:+ start:323 stop:898 length:576 start_codon:yes stop_codon:yes gene_type:complete